MTRKSVNYLFCIWVASALFSSVGCNGIYESQLPALIGAKSLIVTTRDVSEEWGGIHGEGYSIETYGLNHAAVEQFTTHEQNVLPDCNEDGLWATYHWHHGAFDTTYNGVLSVALAYGGNKTLERKSANIRSLINKAGVYHAFFYKPNRENPRNVRFFVLDTNTDTMYIVASDI